jgi:Methylamine utilisation protein MauE
MAFVAPACQGLLVVVFLASATGKLRGRRSLRAFADSLVSLRLVRTARALPVAVAVAVAEAATAVLLVAPGSRQVGLTAAAVLMTVLTAGVAVVLVRGTAAPCRCFGVSVTPLSARHLVRNVLLTAAAVLGLLAPGGASPPGAVVAVAAGVLGGILVTILDDVADLFGPSLSSARS